MATFEASADLEAQVRELVQPFVLEAAEEVGSVCEANVTFPGGRSGPVEVAASERGATVAMTGPFAHIEEWGSVNNGPFAPLRRAVEASGLEFDEL